ncbi:MAG: hypothetical protein OEW19_06545 [Acidobacteriota bacterium]|nr:hypothetical protein [Acidobacteriota bacterium]
MKALAMLPRLMLGGILGLTAFLWLFSVQLDDARRFHFVVQLRSSASGTAQLFFDRGLGFSQQDSTAAATAAGDRLAEYRMAMPIGRYRALRFDPGTLAGEYEIGPASIEDNAGRVVATFGPRAFEAVHDLTVVDRTPTTLRVATNAAQPDPQLLAVFGEPLTVAPTTWLLLAFVAALIVCVIGATLVLTILDRALARRRPVRAPAWPLRPGIAAQGVFVVAVASATAGLAATYPLLMGRSLVAPATGGSVMLYDRPPYLPGTLDFTVEDSRGTDTGSMMWGIMPYSKVQREAVAAGEWPLWLRYSGLGRPLWGQGQSMFLDPIHLLSLLIEDPAAGWDLKFVYARVIFAIGAGLAALAATGSVFAGVMVGAAAPFIGYFTFRLNHPAAFSLTYTPWLLGAFVLLSRQREWRGLWWSGAGVAVAAALQMVSATPKEGAVAMLACQIAGLVAVVLGGGTGAERARRTVVFGAAGLAALLLSAPHWLIFLDTLSRAWTVYDVPAVRLAAWPQVSSLALGAVAPGVVWPGANMVATIGLVLSAGAPVPRRERAVWAGCWVSVAGCVAVALGAVPTPWLLAMPLVGNLYSVNTSFFGAALPPMLLATAFGFAGLSRILSSPARTTAFAGLAVLVAAQVFLWQGGLDALGTAGMTWVLVALAAALALPWIAGAWLASAQTRLAGASLLVLVVVILAPGGLHLDTGVPQLDRQLMQPRPRADVDEPSASIRLARAASAEPFRAIGLGNVFFAGTQALYGIEGIIGADAIELPYLRELATAAGMFRHPWIWLSVFTADDVDTLAGLLDLFGVRIVFSPPEVTRPSWRELSPPSVEPLRVFERPTAWPRAFYAPGVERYGTPADLLARLARADGPFAAVQGSDEVAMDQVSGLSAQRAPTTAAHRYVLTPNTTTFAVRSTGPGVAVLGEAYEARDFRASLNGVPVPYFRANHVYKAVVLPGPGEWIVRMEYRPRLWTWSWVLAGLGALLIVAPLLAMPLLKCRPDDTNPGQL